MDLTVTFPGGKKVDAQMGSFVIRTDQPVGAGGEATAPSPYALCLASIGTCAGFFILSYLQARSLPTEGVSLQQTYEMDAKSHKVAKIIMTVSLPAAIAKEHHEPILRAAQTCTVKKMIESQPKFEISAKSV